MDESSQGTGRRAAWAEAFGVAESRMRDLVGGLSRAQLNFRPAPKAWSVGQCLDHLVVSMRVYLGPLERSLEKAAAHGREGGEPYGRGTWIGRFLVDALRKPGKRYPAPPSFRPREVELDPEEVRASFEAEIRRFQRALDSSAGLPLGDIVMPWPAFRLLKIAVSQAFELQALHLERHLDQAERVREHPELPL